MPDVIVIGGGVIGLSIAWELAGKGLSVRVLEQGAFGREASWAGAGMLPPGNLANAKTAEARLRGAAHALWPDWSNELTSRTGIDNGFIRCGGIELRMDDAGGPQSSYQLELAALKSEGVTIETEDVSEVRRRFPEISAEISSAYYLPDFHQVRNPRHLQALLAGCAMRGVELQAGCPVQQIQMKGERIQAVQTGSDTHQGAEYVFAGGTWTGQLLSQLGLTVQIEPIKGQIVLLRAEPLPVRSVIQVGRQYLVPRADGRMLVGSTEERSGFDKRNTAGAVGELINFAQRLVPALKRATFEKCWAGLRPFSTRGRPYLGRLPQFANATIAAGHYRYGLQQSSITAVLIRQVLLNQPVLLPDELNLADSVTE
ncbi:glycine oxidase ThiO [Schlesneria sp. T3-172]|uniref:glycine oxidase ThiO n=1 Tax=Schlesneria sphaerica TaxID=3373610 RepID=UPI0037C97B7C